MDKKTTEALKAIASAHTNADMYTREYIITNFINPARAALAEQPTIPEGYALISIDALKAWGKYDIVRDACQYPLEHPTSKPWVGLSNDEIYDMYNEPRSDAEMVEFARAIEAKLKEKNT